MWERFVSRFFSKLMEPSIRGVVRFSFPVLDWIAHFIHAVKPSTSHIAHRTKDALLTLSTRYLEQRDVGFFFCRCHCCCCCQFISLTSRLSVCLSVCLVYDVPDDDDALVRQSRCVSQLCGTQNCAQRFLTLSLSHSLLLRFLSSLWLLLCSTVLNFIGFHWFSANVAHQKPYIYNDVCGFSFSRFLWLCSRLSLAWLVFIGQMAIINRLINIY